MQADLYSLIYLDLKRKWLKIFNDVGGRTSLFHLWEGVEKLLGISVYLGNEEISKQVSYIIKMKHHGCQSIFTSLHIPEDDPGGYPDQLKELGQVAKELAMELMADISPKSLQALGFDWKNAELLLDWGLT